MMYYLSYALAVLSVAPFVLIPASAIYCYFACADCQERHRQAREAILAEVRESIALSKRGLIFIFRCKEQHDR